MIGLVLDNLDGVVTREEKNWSKLDEEETVGKEENTEIGEREDKC